MFAGIFSLNKRKIYFKTNITTEEPRNGGARVVTRATKPIVIWRGHGNADAIGSPLPTPSPQKTLLYVKELNELSTLQVHSDWDTSSIQLKLTSY